MRSSRISLLRLIIFRHLFMWVFLAITGEVVGLRATIDNHNLIVQDLTPYLPQRLNLSTLSRQFDYKKNKGRDRNGPAFIYSTEEN
jgi:hypothetical protein